MNVTIFSRGPNLYSTRRLVEAAQQRGHATSVVDHVRCSPALDGGASALLYEGKPLAPPDVAIPRIGTNITNRGVAVIRQLDVMGIPHTMDAAALRLARDKMACLQVLASHNVPVPQTILCFTMDEVRRAGRMMGLFPIVVKLLESTHGVGVSLARTSYQLEQVADAFLRLQGPIILQEFVEESDGRDIRALVVGGKVVAAMERKAAAGEFRANMHRGATASTLTLSPEDKALAVKTARVIGVEVAGVDLIPSDRGPLLMEVNASPGLEGIETHTEIDVAGAIVDYAVSKVFQL